MKLTPIELWELASIRNSTAPKRSRHPTIRKFEDHKLIEMTGVLSVKLAYFRITEAGKAALEGGE